MKRMHLSATSRFALPIVIESVLTILITHGASKLIGGINSTSLAATGSVNLIVTFLTAALAIANTGTVVIVAREAGAGDVRAVGHSIEQGISLMTILSLALSAAVFLCARPILALLLPNAEEALIRDSMLYLRVTIMSLMPVMLANLLGGVMRAVGSPKTTMVLIVGMNFLYLAFAWLFVRVFGLDVLGVGVGLCVSRVAGAVAALLMIIHMKERCIVDLKRAFRPDREAFKRICRVGGPSSIEQIAVQGGYLVANTMVVGLGTISATAYQACNTVNNFTNIPYSICSALALSLIGIRLGEGKHDEAKKTVMRVWVVGAASVTAIGLAMALLSRTMVHIYSSDEAVIALAPSLLWILFLTAVPGLSINVIDSSLKSGGDAGFTMVVSLVCVWLIRIPLTWLMGYRLGMGVVGVYWANFICLFIRAACGLIRFFSGKWIHRSL